MWILQMGIGITKSYTNANKKIFNKNCTQLSNRAALHKQRSSYQIVKIVDINKREKTKNFAVCLQFPALYNLELPFLF